MRAYKTLGARENKRVMCDPYIFVLVAMELSPKLYAEVVTWVTDTLILNRIEAGDLYNKLASSVSKLKDPDYAKMAKALNYIVVNKHETQIRDKFTREQLKELGELQSKLSFAIDMGYITTFDGLLDEMRKLYILKYENRADITSPGILS